MLVQTVDVSKLIVTQSNDLASARYSMTLQEKRLVLILAAMVRLDHDTFYRYRIPVIDLPSVLEVDPKNIYRETSKVCDKLLSRVVHIKTDQGWRKFQWISYAEYRRFDEEFNGAVLELEIHPQMKPYFLELKERFANIPLYHLAQLPSFHSLHLFLILWHEGHSFTRPNFYLDLNDLKERLEVQDKYKNFNDFDRRILQKAQKDFERTTPMRMTYRTKRRGRKVVGIHFNVTRDETNLQMSLEMPQWLRYAEVPLEAEIDKQSSLLQRFTNYFGIKPRQANEFMQRYDANYIRENLDIVEKRHKEGKVRNLAAYVYQALVNDYRSLEAKKQREQDEKKKANLEQQQSLEQAYENRRSQVIENIKEEIGLDYLLEEFLPQLEQLSSTNKVLAKHLKKLDREDLASLTDKTVQSYFHNFLIQNYAALELRSLEAWTKANEKLTSN